MYMGKGYSIDLRERVLNAIDEGSSKEKAHLLFRVSRSTIHHWFELRAQTGSMALRVQGNRRAPQVQGAVFEEFVKRHAHSALDYRSPVQFEKNWTKQNFIDNVST